MPSRSRAPAGLGVAFLGSGLGSGSFLRSYCLALILASIHVFRQITTQTKKNMIAPTSHRVNINMNPRSYLP